MMRAMQAAAIVALLGIAVLCGFGCWGIRSLVMSEAQIAADADVTVKAATGMEAKAGAVADNLNGLISETRPQISETMRRLNGTIAHLDETAAGLDTTVAKINAPCAPGPCGTLADVAKTLNTFRGTAGRLEIAADHEDKRLTLLDDQEQQLADDTHADLAKLGGALDGIQELASNKDLQGTLAHVNGTMTALDGMAAETQAAWHEFLHPKWPKRVAGAVTTWGGAVAKFFVP